MIDDIKKDAEKRMHKAIDAVRHVVSKLRTGRAHPSLVEEVMVSYYGTDTPLNQVASINIQDARTLAITPWEKQLIPDIEKAILASDLGLNPVTSGEVVRIPLPALTEERRRDLIKVLKHEIEQGRVAIRNIRRDANHQLKELLKAKTITEDEQRRAEEMMQKLTDKNIAEVDEVFTHKEAELLEI